MKKQNFTVLIRLVVCICLTCCGLKTMAKNTFNGCKDSISQTQIYIPIMATWENISSLMYDCVANRLDVIDGHYQHIKDKAWDRDYQKYIAIAKIAKKYSELDTCTVFSMKNDTIYLMENYRSSEFNSHIWDHQSERVLVMNMTTNKLKEYKGIFKNAPELKTMIENWDYKKLATFKMAKNRYGPEQPVHVFRIIIQNNHIINCEWVLIEAYGSFCNASDGVEKNSPIDYYMAWIGL